LNEPENDASMTEPETAYGAQNEPAPHPPETRDLQRRLAYLDLTEEDHQRLRALSALLKRWAPAFVEQFYEHLFAFEETAAFLRDPALVARLKLAQQSHLESMLEADWDEAYVARRHHVGDVHAQVGINPQMFLGAYNQYLQFCLRKLATDETIAPEGPQEIVENLLSLLKAVFFDIGLTLDAYFLQATQNLRQALDLVFRANTELRQFAQLTSHDLKTPLATVANLCDEALDEFGDKMPAGARELVDAARNRAFRMSTTIDELLSSTMSLHNALENKMFSSREAIQDAIERVQPLLERKNIHLAIADNLPTVLGDPARIREAFYNLLSNAAKFIDKEPGQIAIEVEARDDECVFSVSDNGPGIPTEELTRIFVPFRRLPVHAGTPGSGLGLYFTKNLIEQQGGRVWAESTPGEGSRFYISLKRPSEASGH